jgi:hypothetical protein
MKHHHFVSALFASVFLLTSCATPATPTSTPEPPPTVAPTADPMPVVEAFLTAHNAHDAEAAGAFMTDDVMLALPIRVQRHLHTEPIVGKEEVTAYLVSDAWVAITIEGSNFQVEGNRVLFNCKIFSNGALLGSGTISSNSACLLVVENDLITFIGDQAEALLFLGD